MHLLVSLFSGGLPIEHGHTLILLVARKAAFGSNSRLLHMKIYQRPDLRASALGIPFRACRFFWTSSSGST